MPKTVNERLRSGPSARSAPNSRTMRKTNASDRPIWRARARLRRSAAATTRTEMNTTIVDAEHDLERGQRDERGPGMRDRSGDRACVHSALLGQARRRRNRARSTHQAARDPRSGRRGRAAAAISASTAHSSERRDVERAQPRDPHRMEELERHEGQHREQRRSTPPRATARGLQQEQIERHHVPERRKAAKVVVRRSSSRRSAK